MTMAVQGKRKSRKAFEVRATQGQQVSEFKKAS